jgi:endoglucanase
MRLTLPFALGLYAVLSVSACGSSDSGSAGERSAFSGASAMTSVGAAQNSGGASAHGGTSDAPNLVAQGGTTGAATSSSAGSGGAAPLPTAMWNSAKSASVTDEQLQAEYTDWKSAHTQSCSNGSWVVVDDGTVVSEGIGYGLLLSVAMADQTLFDGLLKYYDEHLDSDGLMNSKTGVCDAPGNNNANAASDADLDSTMALVQAATRWPSGGYQSKAQALASKIAQFETAMCSGRRVLRPGDTFGGCTDSGDMRINPSYFAPGYYKVFAHYFTDQASTWTALADGSYQLYALYQARMDNLVPDWSGPDGSDNGSGYSLEACRTPWRVAVDYAWTGDTRAKTFLENISSWVDGHGGLPSAAQAQNSAFVGAFALAGGYDQGKFDGYMSAWLGAKLDDAPYYQGSLRVLYLLVAAGKFSSTL